MGKFGLAEIQGVALTLSRGSRARGGSGLGTAPRPAIWGERFLWALEEGRYLFASVAGWPCATWRWLGAFFSEGPLVCCSKGTRAAPADPTFCPRSF